MGQPLRRLTAAVAFSLLAVLAACAPVAQEPEAIAPMPGESRQADANAAASEESTFGEPIGLWEIPREVQMAYAKAICTAPESEFGYAGTFDEATGSCTTSNDMTSDADFLMRGLLSKDATQMRQATHQMLAQAGVQVPECPASGGSDEGTVSNECVIAAMRALTSYLSD